MIHRMRRLRGSKAIRAMVRETRVHTSNLIMPIFLVPGTGVEKEISSLRGQFHFSIDRAVTQAKKIFDAGIPATLLFAIPEFKDARGSAACDDHGIVQEATRAIKKHVPGLSVITDLCFCEYTDHGHCGALKGEYVDNDETLGMLVEQALSHARAGADIIAPSGMMDNFVAAIRHGLDEASFTELPIMAYSAKMASSFYGPFREAVQSAPQFGDRKSYQMDPANQQQAIREVALDVAEGADIVMVKPALPCLDIIYRVKTEFGLPTAAYNVSGEYAMVKAAAEKGWIDERRVMLEMLTSIKRAGADMIISYFSMDYAALAKGGVYEE